MISETGVQKEILPNIFKNSFMFILSVLPACVSVLNACLVPEEIRRQQLVVSHLVGAGNSALNLGAISQAPVMTFSSMHSVLDSFMSI